MNWLKTEYQTRLNEFDELLSFLEFIENNNIYNSQKKKISIDSSVINSTKSSLMLMIYNIIEYTILNSIAIIEKDFKNQNFDDFKTEFQSLFLKTFGIYINELTHKTIEKKIKNENLLSDILNNIIEFWYFKNTSIDLNKKCKIKAINSNGNMIWISWNICYQTIEVLSILFDFKKSYTREINARVDLLKDIREKRNNLAHGNVSFNFEWKNLTVHQISGYRKNVDKFLLWYIAIVDKYIKDKPYLKVKDGM